MNAFTAWFVRVFKPVKTYGTSIIRELEKTADDRETAAPRRRKAAARRAPERK